MPRKPKTHIEAALAHQKREDKKARDAKRAARRMTQQVLPHTARPKRPKKTKWVQLTIDHAIQQFDEAQRHVELQQFCGQSEEKAGLRSQAKVWPEQAAADQTEGPLTAA